MQIRPRGRHLADRDVHSDASRQSETRHSRAVRLTAAIRLGLIAAALLFVVLMIAIHGARALGLIVVVVLIWAITGTRAWRSTIATLTRITGSQRNAYATLGFALILIVAAFELYQTVHH